MPPRRRLYFINLLSITTTMEVFTLILTIVLAIVAISGGIFGILAYVKQSKQASTQEKALRFQFAQHEANQKKQIEDSFRSLNDGMLNLTATVKEQNSITTLEITNLKNAIKDVPKLLTFAEVTEERFNNILKAINDLHHQIEQQGKQFTTQNNGSPRPSTRRKKL